MADSFLSNLSIDVDGLDDDSIAQSETPTPSALSERSSAGPALGLRKRPRPLSSSQNLIGHSFNEGSVQYTVRERSAAKRGAGKQSWIWKYGSELSSTHRHPSWLCHSCWDRGIVSVTSAANTTRAIRHLSEYHRISNDREPEIGSSSSTVSVLDQQRQDASLRRPNQLTISAFLYALIQWIVIAHIALSCVEQQAFQSLIELLNPVVFEYLYTAGNSIRKLILQEHQRRRKIVCEALQQSPSKIHLSFDLWTSPNSLALCGVIAHFLTTDLKSKSLLIGLKRVRGCHSGENIAESILQIIKEYQFAPKLGYFQADNAGDNDTCVQAVFRALSPEIDPEHRRLRCWGHVINLAAKAFLSGTDLDAFELDNSDSEEEKIGLRHEKEQLIAWRKKGCVGKLHNLITWIRRSPQRRQAFAETGKADEEETQRLLFLAIEIQF